MADSASTQPSIQDQVAQRLRTQQVAAQAQTQSELTPIPAAKEAAFREWLKTYKVTDLDQPDSHYDYRGAFLAGVKPDETGHWPDTFKQHGHPTFSTESQYSTGPTDGGHWEGATFVPPNAPAGSAPPSDSTATPLYDRYIRSAFPTGPTPLHDRYVKGAGAGQPSTPLYDRYIGRHPISAEDSATMMQQRPDYPIHFPEEAHRGPFDDIILGAAQQLKDAFLGTVNLVAGPPPPEGVQTGPFGIVSQKSIEQQTGKPFVLTEEQLNQNRTAAAFIASSLVGGVTASTILGKMAPGVIKSTLAGLPGGAAFGALRPRAENESLMGAMVTDAVMFGGLSLAGGLVAKLTKPVTLGVDALKAAGIELEPATLRGPEYGKALFEEVKGISDAVLIEGPAGVDELATATALRRAGLTAEELQAQYAAKYGQLADAAAARGETMPLPHDFPSALAGMPDVTMAQMPANIGVLRRYFGSPSRWADIGGPVGDAAQRIVENAGQRMGVALREQGAWQAVLGDAETALIKDLPLAARMSPMRAGLIANAKQQLGTLLDNVFQPTDLPVTIGKGMARAFTLIRDRLLADRETLRLLVGGTADWGIDAYLPHVFAGKYAITDATSGAIMRLVDIGELKSAVADVLAKNPQAALRVVPKGMVIPAELSGIGLTGRQLGMFISRASRALSIDRDEIASVLFENRVARVKPGKKFFGHVLERGEPALPGYETDPFTALRIYAAGATRKMAFHDFEQKAGAILDDLGRTAGAKTSVDALKVYVDRVLGRPSELETAVRATFQEIARRATSRLSPGMQQFAEELVDPRVLASKLNAFEAMARLGYSPVAWYTNLTQTLVNTSSAIGWGPTVRGLRLFLDPTQRSQVDALLRALDINLSVPLSAADQIVTRNIGQVSPFHPLYLFNKVETANRAIAALAKYQEQILKGADIRPALEEARQFVRDTQFDYSAADAPRLLQGPLGATTFQFKKFVIKEMEFMYSLRKNPAALARFTTNVWATGGISALFALPPLMLLDWAAGELTGEKLSEHLQSMAPRLSRGLPGLAGVDVGGSVAIGLPRETGDVVGPGIIDLWTMARDMIGKPLLDLVRGKQGHLTPQDRAQAVAELVPITVRRLMDAHDVLSKGVVMARGTNQLKYTPENPEREALLMALGARSIQQAEEQRVSTTIKREVQLHAKDEQAVVQAWANAFLNGETEQASKILMDAQHDELLITQNQLRDALAAALLERTTRAAKAAPPELRLKEFERVAPLRGRP